MTQITVPITKLDEDARIPEYAYAGDAGVDLEACEDVTIRPFERVLVSTGLAVAIPSGFAGFVLPRSGVSHREGLTLINTPGLIDSQYRGELKISAVNLDPAHDIEVRKGDRIAQLVILPVPVVTFDLKDNLDETDRSTQGFGSSGK
jgi:dUTP pyrophosphatase